MAGLNPTPFFRYLAAASLLKVFWYYAGALTASQLFFLLAARDGSAGLATLGWLLFLVPFSIVFNVVALYRDDDLLAASVALGLLTAVGALAARALVSIILTRSIGPTVLMIGVAPIPVFVRLVVSIPVLAGMVWLSRKARRYIAPETLDDERISAV